jgi:uncharacterized protein (TIGR03435 family)
VTLPYLIGSAYKLKRYQMTTGFFSAGNQGQDFDIEATIADGITEQVFREMQINLLKTRFGMQLHFEQRQTEGFDLAVSKSKLKVAPPRIAPPQQPGEPEFSGPPVIDRDGFPTVKTTRPYLVIVNGLARWVANNSPVTALVEMLEQQLRAPVANTTGLDGEYDFALKWGFPRPRNREITSPIDSPPSDDVPTLVMAVEEQLGLKLVPKRLTISVPVVDHIEKDPTAN